MGKVTDALMAMPQGIETLKGAKLIFSTTSNDTAVAAIRKDLADFTKEHRKTVRKKGGGNHILFLVAKSGNKIEAIEYANLGGHQMARNHFLFTPIAFKKALPETFKELTANTVKTRHVKVAAKKAAKKKLTPIKALQKLVLDNLSDGVSKPTIYGNHLPSRQQYRLKLFGLSRGSPRAVEKFRKRIVPLLQLEGYQLQSKVVRSLVTVYSLTLYIYLDGAKGTAMEKELAARAKVLKATRKEREANTDFDPNPPGNPNFVERPCERNNGLPLGIRHEHIQTMAVVEVQFIDTPKHDWYLITEVDKPLGKGSRPIRNGQISYRGLNAEGIEQHFTSDQVMAIRHTHNDIRGWLRPN